MTDTTEIRIMRVANALRDTMPGLTSPEAWPWLTLAQNAIGAAGVDHLEREIARLERDLAHWKDIADRYRDMLRAG